jgi:hypothetical protein
MPRQLTISDKLLLAAHQLVKQGKPEFAAEDLVVAAWRMYPDAFGLSGHTDQAGRAKYPDSNRVFAEIMGAKPIRKQGYLQKVGTKIYRLTEAGIHKAEYLAGAGQAGAPLKGSLPREVSVELKRLLASRALSKQRNGQMNDITFYDACTFWGITPRSSAIELEGRLKNFTGVVEAARGQVAASAAAFQHAGATYDSGDLEELRSLNAFLRREFSREIDIIGKRTDERA